MNKVLCILTILFGITQLGYGNGTFISEMRCDNRLGSPYIDSEEPALSWIISSEERNKMQSAIIENHNGHFSTGIHGAKHLYSVLSDENHGDIALRILKNTTYPSIGYLFSLGATTMWENWSLTPNHRGVPRSRNHPMNTGFATWFSQSLGGINTDESEPAFKKIILKPDFLNGLTSVHETYNSPYGLIVSDWERKGNLIQYSIKVPFNSVAEVYLPVTTRKKTLESRTPADKAEGVKLLRKEGNFSIYLVGSGEYSFEIHK